MAGDLTPTPPRGRHALLACLAAALTLAVPHAALATPPAFDCDADTDGVRLAICADPDLGTLERTLAETVANALAGLPPGRATALGEEQAAWWDQLKMCGDAAEPARCIGDALAGRTALVAARFDLAGSGATETLVCADGSGLVRTTFPTAPVVIRLDRGAIRLYLVERGTGVFAGGGAQFRVAGDGGTLVLDGTETTCAAP